MSCTGISILCFYSSKKYGCIIKRCKLDTGFKAFLLAKICEDFFFRIEVKKIPFLLEYCYN